MNEVSNFFKGNYTHYQRAKHEDPFYNLSYFTRQDLEFMTIDIDSLHYGNLSEYDVHNLYGILQSRATYNALKEIDFKLPFILSRSSTTGSGKFVAHWLGDNKSTWSFMIQSIGGNLNMQIFGIPFVGADVCGFGLSTNPELCARWTQVGVMYPFMRNHNIFPNPTIKEGRDQEFYNLGEGLLNSARLNVKLRYSLIKYFHSVFLRRRGIGAVIQSLIFLYPEDEKVYIEEVANKQFLWDDALMVTGVFEQGVQHIYPYFPSDYWYNFHSGKPIHTSKEKGSFHQVYSPVSGLVPLFIKGGRIIFQQSDLTDVRATKDLNNNFKLICALEPSSQKSLSSASGFITLLNNFDDEGVIGNCIKNNCVMGISVFAKNLFFFQADDIEQGDTADNEEDKKQSIILKFENKNTEYENIYQPVQITKLVIYGIELELTKEIQEIDNKVDIIRQKINYELKTLELEFNSLQINNDVVYNFMIT